MFDIIRRDPYREMMRIRNTMDRFFDEFFTGLPMEWRQPWFGELALDVAEKDDEFIVKASLPGINPDDLEITFSQNTLTIKGETKAEKEEEEAHYHLRERRYGSFARSITLPTDVNPDDIHASYEAGVLTLHLPKTEEVKPKRIAIKSAEPKMIEGKARDIGSKN